MLYPILQRPRLRSHAVEFVLRLPAQWCDYWELFGLRITSCSGVWSSADCVWLKDCDELVVHDVTNDDNVVMVRFV